MKIAVIPARGGSKRIPRKNIRPFCGKPMMAWSIEAAFASGCFDRVVVSTDDEEIAATARTCGAEVPFMRPAPLADDHTGTLPVMADALLKLQPLLGPVDLACCLYATAALISPEHLRWGLQRILEAKVDYAFTVLRYANSPQRALALDSAGHTSFLFPQFASSRTQDLTPAWHDAGQFYWGRTSAWLAQRPVLGGNTVALELPKDSVVDIDTLADWERAERLFLEMHNN